MPKPTTTALVLLALAGCGSTPSEPTPPGLTPGFRLVEAAELHEIASTSGGRTRVVNFWATWCGPCVAEMPELKAFAADHPEVDVVLVNLDYPTLTTSHVRPFLERHALHGLHVVQLDDADPATAVAEAVADWPHAIPYTLVLDPNSTRTARFTTQIAVSDLEAAVGPR